MLLNLKNTLSVCSILSLAMVPVALSANVFDSAVCLRDGVTRIVELRVEGSRGVPCSVEYVKPDEGQPVEQLWSAEHDAGYCETQFDQFLKKLEGELNWSCELNVLTKEQLADTQDRVRAQDRVQAQTQINDQTLPQTLPQTEAASQSQTLPQTEAASQSQTQSQTQVGAEENDVLAHEPTQIHDGVTSASDVAQMIDKRAADRRSKSEQQDIEKVGN